MNELKIVSHNGKLVTDSREVAEMVERPHNDLMKSIRGYIEHLGQGDFSHSDFFISDSYSNSQNKKQPRFLITKKGCDMVANKMTGQKGVLFTAAYVTKFEEMEEQLKPSSIEDLIIMQANSMKDVKERLGTMEKKLDYTSELLALHPTEWRKKTTAILNKIAQSRGGFGEYQSVRVESYQLLEDRARCLLSNRLTNRRRKMALEGAAKSKIDKTNKMDVIADDARLTEIYLSIVKEMAIKHEVSLESDAS